MIIHRLEDSERLEFSLEGSTNVVEDLVDLVDDLGLIDDNEGDNTCLEEEAGDIEEDTALTVNLNQGDDDEATSILRTDPRWQRTV